MDHRLRILSFLFFQFFFFQIDFFEVLTDLEFLISTVRLFHSFMQYGKNVFLNDFILGKRGLITGADTDIKG